MKNTYIALMLATLTVPYCHAQDVLSSAPELALAAPNTSAQGGPSAALVPMRGESMALLQRMILLAIEHSPQLREDKATARAAGMDTKQAKGARWPKIDLSGSSRPASFGAASTPNGDGSTGRLGVTATYNLYDAGRTTSDIKSHEFTQLSAAAKIALTRETVVFDTVNIYLEIIKQQKIVDLYKGHIVRLTLLVSKLNEVVKAFIGRRSELTQANARLGQARDGLDLALAKQRESRLVLVRLLGSPALIPSIAQSIPHFEELSPEQALEDALLNHPSLKAAAADIESLRAAVKTATASRLPQLDLEATKLTGRDINGNLTPGQIYLGVRWTAFQGFAGEAAESAAIDRADAAEERYQQGKIDVEYKIQNAWTSYQTNISRLPSLRSLAFDTDQVRKDYYVQWNDLGRRSLLEVLTAENDYLSTLLNLTTSEVDQELAAARVRFEAGELAAWIVGSN